MKRLIVTLILLITSSATYSQNSYKLDQKNGFNIFILGTSLQENKKLVKLNKAKMKEKSDVLEMYEIKGVNAIKLFGYDLGSIHLLFYKDMLLQIEVNFKNFEIGTADQSALIGLDVSNKIEKEYGFWIRQELLVEDNVNNVLLKEYINSTKVCLWHHIYKGTNIAAFRTIQPGDRYTFVSNEIFNKMNAEQGNPSGL